MADPGAVDALVERLEKLHEKRPRAWGKMTPHEMVCHLTDSFQVALGERPCDRKDTWARRTFVRRIALHTTFAWPKGIPTMPEVDQGRKGTRPVEFAADRARLIEIIRRFDRPDTRYAAHPMMGPLTREEWLIWGYRHTDHHLRQFAL
jgi:hypothetical protein